MTCRTRPSARSSSAGINIIEATFVLVLLGLLSGLVLSSMDILDTVRTRNLMRQHDELSAAVTMFHQQAGGLPGDENNPGFPSNDAVEGNHDRIITLPDNSTNTPNERANVFPDLAAAGYVELENGSAYPKNPFGGTVSIMFHALNRTGDAHRTNYMAFSNVPGHVIADIDKSRDDGKSDSGDILSGIMPDPENSVLIGRTLDYNAAYDLEHPGTLYWVLRW